MNVAVTGSSGYLGRLLVGRLAREPSVKAILGLDISTAPPHPKLVQRQADLRRTDFSSLLRRIDLLYHLAFVVSPPRQRLSEAAVDAINIEGTRRVVQGAIVAGVKKIIYASSIVAYGAHPDNPPLLTEESPLRSNRDWYYSRAKGAVEQLLERLATEHPAICIIRLRPDSFVGPTATHAMARMVRLPVLLTVAPNLKLSFTWDEDTVEGFWLAAQHHRSDVFNLTGDNPIDTREIGRRLKRPVLALDRRRVCPLLHLAQRLGVVDPMQTQWVEIAPRGPMVASSQKARQVLGWTPKFDSPGALQALVART